MPSGFMYWRQPAGVSSLTQSPVDSTNCRLSCSAWRSAASRCVGSVVSVSVPVMLTVAAEKSEVIGPARFYPERRQPGRHGDTRKSEQ